MFRKKQRLEISDDDSEVWYRQRAKVWFSDSDPGYSNTNIRHESLVEHNDPAANLITSLIEGTVGETNLHAPVIDLDFPCELRPSSTEGHFHLLLNKKITWEQYRLVIIALMGAGLIEEGWAKAALDNQKSAIRAEGVIKYEIEPYRKNLSGILDSLES